MERDMLIEVETLRTELHALVDRKCDEILHTVEKGTIPSINAEVMEYPITASSVYFKGAKPLAVILPDGTEVQALSWRAVTAVILKECNKEPEFHWKLMYLRGKITGRSRTFLAESPDDMDCPLEIDKDLYFEGKLDVSYLFNILNNDIFQNIGYEYSGIKIKVKTKQ